MVNGIEAGPEQGEGQMTTEQKKKQKAERQRERRAAKKATAAPAAAPVATEMEPAPESSKWAPTGPVPAVGSLKLVGVTGGKRNRYVNLTFTNGFVVRLHPIGYAPLSQCVEVRDVLVDWLTKHLS